MADTDQSLNSNAPVRLALISSGLGFVQRGIETWMTELAHHLPASLEVELWGGGKPPVIPDRPSRSLCVINRDAALLRPLSWHRRYQTEQQSALPRAIHLLRRQRMSIAYCGDPVLAWHLKRFQRLHRARVVFMNGMRLSPRWARVFDGVQLLAPWYLEDARRELGGEQVGQFFVAPHFVDTGAFRPPTDEQRSAARQELGLSPGAFVVLNVGPVGTVSGKRLEWLAREMATADTGRTMHSVSVGGDEAGASEVHAQFRAALGDRFHPCGSRPRDRMLTYYHAADVYALAALAEPFSIAILEAMACGLPVVHHEFPVTKWITGPAGVCVSMENAGEAAAAFCDLQQDVERRGQLAVAARSEVINRFSAPVICGQLVDELTQVARRQRTGGGR